MKKNTGFALEDSVFTAVFKAINQNEFLVSNPNTYVFKHKKYYSRQREDYIEVDVSVEKYLADPQKHKIKPSLIIVIECKDYAKSVPVSHVEEFHAKMQQIGPDNTKGIMVARKGAFQHAALAYARSNGITLARMLPDEQIEYLMYSPSPLWKLYPKRTSNLEMDGALTNISYISYGHGDFFCSHAQCLTFKALIKELVSGQT